MLLAAATMRCTSLVVSLATVFATACAVPVGEDEPIEDEEAYLDPGVQPGDTKMDADTTVGAS